MKIFKSYSTGFKTAVRFKGISFFIYLILLILALLAVLPLKGLISSSIGNSMSLESLLSQFDYTAYRDFILQNPSVAKIFRLQVLWFGLFYLVLSVFISGGILNLINLEDKTTSVKSFFEGALKYFGRFIRLFLIAVILYVILSIAIFGLASNIIKNYISSFHSELEVFAIYGIGTFIYLLIFIFLTITFDYAKIIIVSDDSSKVLRSYSNSLLFTFKHFFSTYLLYLLLLVIPLLLIISYFIVEDRVGMVSSETIVIMFLIQQLFIWSRIFIKIWIFASQFEFYNSFIPVIEEIVEPVIISDNEEWNLDDLKEPSPQ